MDWLIMPGRVKANLVSDYYSIIDIAPFPRKSYLVTEMVSPMKLYEAMNMKKAVIVSSVDALKEMVVENETALIFEKDNANYSFYIHNSYRKNIGKIISLLQYSSADHNIEIENLSKNLCMHIAAMKPESMDVEDLDKNLIINEEKIQKELILTSGKPSNIVDKILEGKMKKYFSEITLLNQTYILDQEKTIRDLIKEHSKSNFKLISFELINL